MNTKGIKIAVVGIFVLMCFASYAVSAQQPASPKMAVVNLGVVFDEYYKTKEADKALEEKANAKKSERDKIVADVKKMRDELELLSDKAKEKKQADIDEKIKTLQEFDNNATQELRKQRDENLRVILQDIDTVVSDYAKKNKYDIVLNERALAYADKAYNVTDDILKLLNGAKK